MVKRHQSVSVESVKPRSKKVAAISGVVKALMFVGVLTVEGWLTYVLLSSDGVYGWWKGLEVWQQVLFNAAVFLPLFALLIFSCVWGVKVFGAYNTGKGFKQKADRNAVWVKRNSGVSVLAAVLTICVIFTGLIVGAKVFVSQQPYYCINATTMKMDYTTNCYRPYIPRVRI